MSSKRSPFEIIDDCLSNGTPIQHKYLGQLHVEVIEDNCFYATAENGKYYKLNINDYGKSFGLTDESPDTLNSDYLDLGRSSKSQDSYDDSKFKHILSSVKGMLEDYDECVNKRDGMSFLQISSDVLKMVSAINTILNNDSDDDLSDETGRYWKDELQAVLEPFGKRWVDDFFHITDALADHSSQALDFSNNLTECVNGYNDICVLYRMNDFILNDTVLYKWLQESGLDMNIFNDSIRSFSNSIQKMRKSVLMHAYGYYSIDTLFTSDFELRNIAINNYKVLINDLKVAVERGETSITDAIFYLTAFGEQARGGFSDKDERQQFEIQAEQLLSSAGFDADFQGAEVSIYLS